MKSDILTKTVENLKDGVKPGAAGPAFNAISLIAIFFQRLHNVFVHIHLAVL